MKALTKCLCVGTVTAVLVLSCTGERMPSIEKFQISAQPMTESVGKEILIVASPSADALELSIVDSDKGRGSLRGSSLTLLQPGGLKLIARKDSSTAQLLVAVSNSTESTTLLDAGENVLRPRVGTRSATVLTSQQELEEFWNSKLANSGDLGPLPLIDFGKKSIVAITETEIPHQGLPVLTHSEPTSPARLNVVFPAFQPYGENTQAGFPARAYLLVVPRVDDSAVVKVRTIGD